MDNKIEHIMSEISTNKYEQGTEGENCDQEI